MVIKKEVSPLLEVEALKSSHEVSLHCEEAEDILRSDITNLQFHHRFPVIMLNSRNHTVRSLWPKDPLQRTRARLLVIQYHARLIQARRVTKARTESKEIKLFILACVEWEMQNCSKVAT